jgi:hypothetical protein
MFNFGRKIESTRNREELDRAIAACRGPVRSTARLSEAVHATIMQAALDATTRPGPLPQLFFPVRRLVLATLAPAAILVLGVVLVQSLPGGSPRSENLRIQAAKQGDQVVFTVADGKRPHVAYKSTSADRFDRSNGIRVEHNRFVDSASAGPSLVFYTVE